MGNAVRLKACPFCGEEILAVAIKCKHCSSMLSEDDALLSQIAVERQDPTNQQLQNICICCRSADVTVSDDRQGFGAGKALAGALVLGPVGLLAGAINKDKRNVHLRCNTCLQTFTAEQLKSHRSAITGKPRIVVIALALLVVAVIFIFLIGLLLAAS